MTLYTNLKKGLAFLKTNTYLVTFIENVFQFLSHVVVEGADGSVVKLHPDLALDMPDHPNPGTETNCNVDCEVLQRDQVLAVNAENDLRKSINNDFKECRTVIHSS